MSIFEPAASPWPSRMLSVLRIVVGLVFLTFGTMKVFNVPPMPAGMPPIMLGSKLGLAGVLELVGGSAILLGFLTRPVSFVLAGEMAVAYFQGHFPQSFWPQINMGTPAILFCFIYLYLMVAGAGEWSVDALLARSRSSNPL